MPIYLYWGEDDYAIQEAVKNLQEKVVDPQWIQFNYYKITGNSSDSVINALNGAMTPVFGTGERLVWLADTSLCQQCPDDLLKELQRTLPDIPPTSHLLLTTNKKPDSRLKSTKLLQTHGQVKEFSPIPPWKIDEIAHHIGNLARERGLKLTSSAIEELAQSVGNNSRQLSAELTKLKLYAGEGKKTIDKNDVMGLVGGSSQSSLELAKTILKNETGKAVELVGDLLARNEPALSIVATLTGQFRTWAIVKLHLENGEKDDKLIAVSAEIANVNRLYFIRKEIQAYSGKQLLSAFPLLLELEQSLKRGAEPLATLQTKVIQLCCLF
ncbi:MAG: hypothetical protein N5P05_001520 [Chroococcopsis gigantea SAG 12.99]|jgi:DNA polymerase-3 subunit delta|nr:DNA polymerase III subunit delta [Chlorogloea purpurea SAG 13.99]MDV2999914.1 hypothetical protein [Chroococcopsis gigantea SAG 12.99]